MLGQLGLISCTSAFTIEEHALASPLVQEERHVEEIEI